LSTVRVLPLGAPVMAGFVMSDRGAMIVLCVLGLILTFLVVRSVLLRAGSPEGPHR
jgi:hypothetical protein